MITAQSKISLPTRNFNQPISNKSNSQFQLALELKNEITIKINRLSELKGKDDPVVYYQSTSCDFQRKDDVDYLNSNLGPIRKLVNVPIRTRQFLKSTYQETCNEMNNTVEVVDKPIDPIESLIRYNQSRFQQLTFNNDLINISEDYIRISVSTNTKKGEKRSNDQTDFAKKKHRYDLPLENSRVISAKEVLRMVDSSLISSDMEYSQINSTSNSLLNESTPLKNIPSYLKFFNGNVLSDTPLKRNSISSSTPQMTGKFLNLLDDKYSPLTGSKLKNL